MNIFLKPDEEVEILPVEPNTDFAKINPLRVPKGPHYSELAKEIAAIDAIETSIKEASEISGISRRSVTRYTNGEDVEEDVKARILAKKYEAADTAVVLLMDTLKVLDPSDMKDNNKIALINSLTGLLDKSSKNDKEGGSRVMHLHLYGVDQKKVKDYDIIDA